MTDYPWFRYYSETPHDKKLDLIAEESEFDYLLVLGAWSVLLCVANGSPVRGSLYVTTKKRYSNGYLSKLLRLPEKDTDKLLKFFLEYEMLELDENGAYRIKNFEKRQYKSDSSTPRVTKHRANKKKEKEAAEAEECNADETLHETLHSVSASASVSDSLNELEGITPFTMDAAIEDYELATIYTNVTGNMGLPVSEKDKKSIINSIREIYSGKKEGTKDYLKLYFEAWRDRKYQKTNFGWLDWALAGEIPEKKNGNQSGNKRNIKLDGQTVEVEM